MKQVILSSFWILCATVGYSQQASVYDGAEHKDSICTAIFDSTAFFFVSVTKRQIYYENKGDTLLDADIYEFDSVRSVIIWYGYLDREYQVYGLSNIMVDSTGGVSIQIDNHRDKEVWFNISKEKNINPVTLETGVFLQENRSLNKTIYRGSRLVYISISR